MGWIVGVFGMIAAILVTSTIIPQMFEPGSIKLLLSKPVSRSACSCPSSSARCAFILLNVSLLLGGLWLIAGTRFGIWNQGMLWCIPLFLFMFLIYYAVSAFTGLIWKSPVISVVMTVLFWIACFTLDLTSLVINAAAIEPRKLADGAGRRRTLIAGNEAGQCWPGMKRPASGGRCLSPAKGAGFPRSTDRYYHEPTKQMLVGQGFSNPFGSLAGGSRSGWAKLEDGWTLREGPALPSGTAVLVVDHEGGILAVAPTISSAWRGNRPSPAKPVEIFGMRVPFTSSSAEFRPLLADRTHFTRAAGRRRRSARAADRHRQRQSRLSLRARRGRAI